MHTYDLGRTLMGRLPPGTDLLAGVERVARENKVQMATFQCLGAVRRARLAKYDQQAKRYREFAVDEEMEMIVCVGNVSPKEGAPFVHAHLSLANDRGETISGHARPGIEVFVCEVILQEWRGDPLVREPEAITGLWMWPAERW